MEKLYDLPLQEDIDINRSIDILAAPPGLHDVVSYSDFSKE